MTEHSQEQNVGKRPRPTSFIRKLYDMLSKEQYREQIAWNEPGEAFLIFKPLQFDQAVLSHYFKSGKLDSFLRQLNMYSFTRKRSGSGAMQYLHQHFQRDNEALLPLIRRKKQEKPRRRKNALQKNRKIPQWSGIQTPNIKLYWKSMSRLININRRILEENKDLWKLITLKVGRIPEEIDPEALGSETKLIISEFVEAIKRQSQNAEVIRDIWQSETSIIQRSFEDVLSDYQAIRSIADSNFESAESGF